MTLTRSHLVLVLLTLTSASPSLASPAAPDRFPSVPVGDADYTTLRDIVRVFVRPGLRTAAETSGVSLCALDKAGELLCAGTGGLGQRFATSPPTPAFATPCFETPGVFSAASTLVDLDITADLCALSRGGQLFCSESLTTPLLGRVDAHTPSEIRPLALTQGAVLYEDQTIRTRLASERSLGPPRPLNGLPTRAKSLVEATEDAFCVLGEDHHVYCTDETTQGDISLTGPTAPLVFHRIAAASPTTWPAPVDKCTPSTCEAPLANAVSVIAAGRFSFCALAKDDKAGITACWESPHDRPWRMPAFTSPTAIAGSGSGVCAITKANTVECVSWDDLTEGPTAPLAAVPGLTGVTQLAVSSEVLCAATQGGRVDCRFLTPAPVPDPPSSDFDIDDAYDPPVRWKSSPDRPAVAVLPWTRDIAALAFTGTYSELDDTTSPLLGITRSGELLGARPPAGVTGPGFQLRQGLPCIHHDGQTWCREVDDDKEIWGPWTLAAAPKSPRLPWWVTAPTFPSDLVEALDKDPRTPAKIIAMDDIPCVRFTDGSVACLRRGATSTTLAPVPAPRSDQSDICASHVATNPTPLRGVIDIDGAHGIGCVLLENRDIACWGTIEFLGLDIPTPKQRRWAPQVVANIPGAKSIAATTEFVCALTDKGQVHCIGEPARGRAPGRWGGFGATPQPVVGLDKMTGLATLPGFWLACAWSTPTEDPATTPSARTDRKDRKDPLDDPSGFLSDALALGRAACWGDDDALRYLNATLLGRPKRR